ncbi:MAG: hypothetical protein QXN56_06045, partial [Candidatus Hadarchaeum sp.]
FMASQMENAVFEQTTLDISDQDLKSLFRAGVRILKIDGYLKVYSDTEDDDKDWLLRVGLL